MKTKQTMFRQGDVLLVACSIPKTAKRIKMDGRLVLALGEVTGPDAGRQAFVFAGPDIDPERYEIKERLVRKAEDFKGPKEEKPPKHC